MSEEFGIVRFAAREIDSLRMGARGNEHEWHSAHGDVDVDDDRR